jgi:hypothetical protein
VLRGLADQLGRPLSTIKQMSRQLHRDGGLVCRLTRVPCRVCGLPVAGPPQRRTHVGCRAPRPARRAAARRRPAERRTRSEVMRRQWHDRQRRGWSMPPAGRAKLAAAARKRWAEGRGPVFTAEHRAKQRAAVRRYSAAHPRPPKPPPARPPRLPFAARSATNARIRRETIVRQAAAEPAQFAAWLAERARLGPVDGTPRHRHVWCADEDRWLGEHAWRPLSEQAGWLGRTAGAVEARRLRLGTIGAAPARDG